MFRLVSIIVISGLSVATGFAQQENGDSQCHAVQIASLEETGQRLSIRGRVLDYTGNPLEKAAIVVYHADSAGLYNKPGSATRTPRLRAVAVTDEEGRFLFTTIKPGPYPDSSEPAHIHVEVNAPAHNLRYITYWFEGDPLITDSKRRAAEADTETIIVELVADPNGELTFAAEIALDAN